VQLHVSVVTATGTKQVNLSGSCWQPFNYYDIFNTSGPSQAVVKSQVWRVV